MKRVIAAVVALLAVFVAAFFIYTRDLPVAEKWTVWIADGKSDPIEMDPVWCDNLADSYFDLLKRITYWNVVVRESDHGTPTQRAPYQLGNITPTMIGTWGKYEVWDLTNESISHKSIILRDERGHFWPLYVQWWSTLTYALPVIAKINGHDVLSYRVFSPGTGNSCIEHHFIYDAVRGRPVRVDTDTVINAAIKAAVPAGYAVWKGGGLDFNELTFSHCIWKRGDANCCPTGGRIDLLLSLDKGKLSVVGSRYLPDFERR